MLRTLAPVATISIATHVLPLDLHVLSLPLAFILSQDQTLHCIYSLYILVRPLSLPVRILSYAVYPIPGISETSRNLRSDSSSRMNPYRYPECLPAPEYPYAACLHSVNQLPFPKRATKIHIFFYPTNFFRFFFHSPPFSPYPSFLSLRLLLMITKTLSYTQAYTAYQPRCAYLSCKSNICS